MKRERTAPIPDVSARLIQADTIVISRLELSTHIGVPPEERAEPQRLTVNLEIVPRRSFSQLGDDIANAVDYFKVCRGVQWVAARQERKLIETLAQDIADFVLAEFEVDAIEVELRKYILPDTEFVAVRLQRERV